MESSRIFLASRTHFEVLGLEAQVLALGLKALSPRKFPCPRLEDSTVFEQLKFRWKMQETLRKICKHRFCFPHSEHRPCQGEGLNPPLTN